MERTTARIKDSCSLAKLRIHLIAIGNKSQGISHIFGYLRSTFYTCPILRKVQAFVLYKPQNYSIEFAGMFRRSRHHKDENGITAYRNWVGQEAILAKYANMFFSGLFHIETSQNKRYHRHGNQDIHDIPKERMKRDSVSSHRLSQARERSPIEHRGKEGSAFVNLTSMGETFTQNWAKTKMMGSEEIENRDPLILP
nr:hypothetical protein [Candidatus Sigynarchaeota archaeon]